MVTHKLILAAAVLAFGCSRSPAAQTPKSAVQTPARPTDNMNAGVGYYGGAAENVNRDGTKPISIGGGPAAETPPDSTEHTDEMDHGSAPKAAETDMTGGSSSKTPGSETQKKKTKLK